MPTLIVISQFGLPDLNGNVLKERIEWTAIESGRHLVRHFPG